MKITIVSATMMEIEPLIDKMKAEDYRLVITGIGSLATAYHLTAMFKDERPELVIQAGIAGSFETSLQPGTVVLVGQDRQADLGAEEDNGWRDIYDLNLADQNEFPFLEGWLKNPDRDLERFGLPIVDAVTINEITTKPQRIAQIKRKYHAAIESMEGAAFHYVSLQQKIPFLQIRAVSNFVGDRDKNNWQIATAIENLNKKLLEIIELHN